MEIIADAEQSPRGIYTGAIGLMCPNDYAQFNVAIRTALIDKQRQSIEYGVGGGIVWDSVPEAEFEESRIKAKVLSSPWPEFSLLETLLWTENEGFFLLERHLARLKNSAKYFDIAFSETEILNILKDTATGKQDSSLKVRLLLSHSGQASCSAEQISISPQPLSTSVVLAREAVSSKNVFLYHKTDYRDLYERHSAESPDSADVLLWNERGELTESTIANLVLEVQGKLLTPPISCGLLPGVFRAELLAAGTIKEEILTLGMLKKASSIYLVNSVRKWQKATMLS
jgi:para-aminobenzoate synthetase/4-amino-4-deoxychorismate lyase